MSYYERRSQNIQLNGSGPSIKGPQGELNDDVYSLAELRELANNPPKSPDEIRDLGAAGVSNALELDSEQS